MIYFFVGSEFSNDITNFAALNAQVKALEIEFISCNAPEAKIAEIVKKIDENDTIIAGSAGGGAAKRLLDKLGKTKKPHPPVVGFEPYGLSGVSDVYTFIQADDPKGISAANPQHHIFQLTDNTKTDGAYVYGHAFYSVRPSLVPTLKVVGTEPAKPANPRDYAMLPAADLTVGGKTYNYGRICRNFEPKDTRVFHIDFILNVARWAHTQDNLHDLTQANLGEGFDVAYRRGPANVTGAKPAAPKPQKISEMDRLFPGDNVEAQKAAFDEALVTAKKKRADSVLSEAEIFALFNHDEKLSVAEIDQLFSTALDAFDDDYLDQLLAVSKPSDVFFDAYLKDAFVNRGLLTNKVPLFIKVSPVKTFRQCMQLPTDIRQTIIPEFFDTPIGRKLPPKIIADAFVSALNSRDDRTATLLRNSKYLEIPRDTIKSIMEEAYTKNDDLTLQVLFNNYPVNHPEGAADSHYRSTVVVRESLIQKAISENSPVLLTLLEHKLRVGNLIPHEWDNFHQLFKKNSQVFEDVCDEDVYSKLASFMEAIPLATALAKDHKNKDAKAAGDQFLDHFQAIMQALFTEDNDEIKRVLDDHKPKLEKAFQKFYEKLPRSPYYRGLLNALVLVLVPVFSWAAFAYTTYQSYQTPARQIGLFAESSEQQKIKRMKKTVDDLGGEEPPQTPQKNQ